MSKGAIEAFCYRESRLRSGDFNRSLNGSLDEAAKPIEVSCQFTE